MIVVTFSGSDRRTLSDVQMQCTLAWAKYLETKAPVQFRRTLSSL